MIQIEKVPLKQITAVFTFAFLMGALLFGWFEYQNIPISYWPTGVDIYPRWVGSKAFWQGESPYSAEVDLETQSYLYGRPAEEVEDPMGFYYPAHAAIVLAPLTLLPAPTAALLWTVTMWAVIALIIFFIIQELPEKTSPMLWLIITLTIFLYRPALISIINGQYTIFTILIWGISYYLIRKDHDILVGFLLALTTIKPSLSLFPLLLFLFWTLANKRTKVFASFMITSILFFVVTLMKLGWWIPQFLSELAEYDSFNRYWITAHIFTLPGIIWLVTTTILIYVGFKDFQENKKSFPWILFWGTISLNLLITPHTAEYDLLILILPFLLFAPRFLQTRPGMIGWMIVFWLPWVYFFFFSKPMEEPHLGLANIWAYYPQIVVLTLLISIYFNRRYTSKFASTDLLPPHILPHKSNIHH